MSKSNCFAMVASVAVVSLGSVTSYAQQPPPQSPDMTFFVTSTGPGKGADLGGLEGADRHCQTLAQNAGAGSKTWRAYLSSNAARPGGAVAPATASAPAPGRTSKAWSSRKTSTIFTVTATSSPWRTRSPSAALLFPGRV